MNIQIYIQASVLARLQTAELVHSPKGSHCSHEAPRYGGRGERYGRATNMNCWRVGCSCCWRLEWRRAVFSRLDIQIKKCYMLYAGLRVSSPEPSLGGYVRQPQCQGVTETDHPQTPLSHLVDEHAARILSFSLLPVRPTLAPRTVGYCS